MVLSYRGPDDSGIWFNKDENIYLSHRRLSILDLSSNVWQLMQLKEGRWRNCFNGEIYNHQEIRKELALIGLVVPILKL